MIEVGVIMANNVRSEIQAATHTAKRVERALKRGRRSGVIGVHRTFWLVVKQKLEGTRSCVIAPNTVARVRLRKHEVHLRG